MPDPLSQTQITGEFYLLRKGTIFSQFLWIQSYTTIKTTLRYKKTQNQYPCVSFLHHEVPNRNNLEKEILILAHGFGIFQSITIQWWPSSSVHGGSSRDIRQEAEREGRPGLRYPQLPEPAHSDLLLALPPEVAASNAVPPAGFWVFKTWPPGVISALRSFMNAITNFLLM